MCTFLLVLVYCFKVNDKMQFSIQRYDFFPSSSSPCLCLSTICLFIFSAVYSQRCGKVSRNELKDSWERKWKRDWKKKMKIISKKLQNAYYQGIPVTCIFIHYNQQSLFETDVQQEPKRKNLDTTWMNLPFFFSFLSSKKLISLLDQSRHARAHSKKCQSSSY